jgi:AraC-like DNA-binding protein
VHLHIMAVDCCEHIVDVLGEVPTSRLTVVASKDRSRSNANSHDVDLIVIGLAQYPVRRLFISQLRRVYPEVPMMVLRRLEDKQGAPDGVRAEFILSEVPHGKSDLEIVRSLRKVLPIRQCEHVHKDNNYDTVREVMLIIAENYSDPDLDLNWVAGELPMSPALLSRILNRQVGISFRQLLATTRIEEAKRMLTSRQYSVKEVAARVGFSDSHYFSRTFKKQTGLSASEYRAQDPIFG